MKTHKDLDGWKKSINFVIVIYRITGKFLKEEINRSADQIRRASFSISSNIAEVSGRAHNKVFMRFINIALGSVAEVDTRLLICNNVVR